MFLFMRYIRRLLQRAVVAIDKKYPPFDVFIIKAVSSESVQFDDLVASLNHGNGDDKGNGGQ